GRSRSCTLRLPGDATVSRQHCLIELEEGAAWVQDLGSLNGTHINGEKIGQRERGRDSDAPMVQPAPQALSDGDELPICNNIFQVNLVDSPVLVEQKKQPYRTDEHGSGSGQMELCWCV